MGIELALIQDVVMKPRQLECEKRVESFAQSYREVKKASRGGGRASKGSGGGFKGDW